MAEPSRTDKSWSGDRHGWTALEGAGGATQHITLDRLASGPRLPPGGNGLFAVDVARGRYGMICFVVHSDGVDHSSRA